MSMSSDIQEHNTDQLHSKVLPLLLEYDLKGLQNNKVLDLTLPLLLFAARLSKMHNLEATYITNVKEILIEVI